jgi:hypothetical protein
VAEQSQHRAIKNYRKRLAKSGFARFEVLGRDKDRELIRTLAKRLAEDGPEAERLRIAVNYGIGRETARKGGIIAALRRSPLVGAEVGAARRSEPGRKVEL